MGFKLLGLGLSDYESGVWSLGFRVWGKPARSAMPHAGTAPAERG